MTIDVAHPHKKTMLQPSSVIKAEILLPSGVCELDVLCGGFKAGEITYVDGTSPLVVDLPNQLCVQTYLTFKSPTLYLDGGVCADPYKIAAYARFMDVDQNDVLDQVHISRAFTVYQLATFVDHLLERELQTAAPRTLIIGDFPALFLDPDVPSKESQTILNNTLLKLHELTSRFNLVTILTNHHRRLYSPDIRTLIESSAHETIRMRFIEPCTYVDLLRQQRSTTILHLATGQLRLEHFGMVS